MEQMINTIDNFSNKINTHVRFSEDDEKNGAS